MVCVECLIPCGMCSDACPDEDDVRTLVRCICLDRGCAAAVEAECERHADRHGRCRIYAEVRCCEAERRRMAGAAA